MLRNPTTIGVEGTGRTTRPDRGAGMRDRICPVQGFLGLVRDKVRPASPKTPILGCFQRDGRTLSRTGRSDVATMQPPPPLQPLMQASVKPPSPLLAPEQQPLKPTTPLQPKNAPKTPISHPQRRHRFQLAHLTGPQRRRRFQTTTPRAATNPLPRKLACNSIGRSFNNV